jgi:hypothetical protein
MSKKMTLVEKVVSFEMSIKGAKLPDNFEAFIKCEIDFTDALESDLFLCCASGSSARVQLQSQLRNKSVEELKGLQNTGLKITFNEIISDKPRVQKSPKDLLMALSREDFVDQMMELGLEEQAAIQLYNKKHS